ncbi:multiple sugar-binding transport system permease protein MsmG [Clostridium pasteurianum DSM 525 = ATCC 6013]|uniref:ABC-type transporter, integral membrane subunit n=1 Tax=Clostridium pasteurianum DSM 525 = ATCC 6013 TaxID=1262449 RepID=A0A0H3J9P6_CLOPA|nr:carbohydrate ABC transporter permease [Clostridium pasteurianum]AJA47880.1 multiple sugar-binding transport system permease protein MsmG [Clostridium pasteurianum DSM 525 = ATCC 6013]AJA51868.1 multiple sugar-binding transport system permease protein MsmG [Clostridium pasteurianum DSM 525 = ATCC 6013]AOZ75171.1 ABC transporter permease [Clostridium pasteurianum DSM 525 = ATCC 6013]AOZ78966.1 ABC transporter permease [Clostridium pasteurianum]ELP59783.1 sugar ABC transporter permease [Clostr
MINVKKGEVKTDKRNWPITIMLMLTSILILIPIYMAVMIAFKQPSEMSNDIAGAFKFPSKFSFSNFIEAIQVTDFFHTAGNSLVITIFSVIAVVLISSMVSFAIARNMERKKIYKFFYLYFVSAMFVPFSMLMLPLVKQMAFLHLDNKIGIIFLYVIFNTPINTLLYVGYLKNVPVSLEEAAYVDGANTWTLFWKIIFPMMKPMHATVAVLTALAAWNDVLLPLVLLSGGDGKDITLPLAQMMFQSQFGTNYNLAFASYILALLPMLIFYLVEQKQVINGVMNGAVKG